jgi:NADPH-dependent glutamate synthase beta subunit-like oxidoreductase
VGIPSYRLPREVVDDEIAHVESVGVHIRCGSAIATPAELLDEGYDAVLVAVGTHRGVKLSLPGKDLPDVLVSTDFLRRANLGEPVTVGERVVVLGGGSVAFDSAGWARRLGAEEVTLVCLEPRDAMRATVEDISEALEAGCLLHNACTFEEITEEAGKVRGVRCQRVATCTFDENGNPEICVEEDSDFVVPADTVIFAVGQRPELGQDAGLELGRGNRVVVHGDDEVETSLPGIFAAGDVVTGTVSVVTAIAAGRRAASAIDRYLGGDGLIDEQLAPEMKTSVCIGREEGYALRPRTTDAPEEAERCLQCDLRLKITPNKFWGEYRSAKRSPTEEQSAAQEAVVGDAAVEEAAG